MILYKLKKKYGKFKIFFEEDLSMDKGGWFITINQVRKSGVNKEVACIIKSDLDVWLRKYTTKGWEEFKEEEETKK